MNFVDLLLLDYNGAAIKVISGNSLLKIFFVLVSYLIENALRRTGHRMLICHQIAVRPPTGEQTEVAVKSRVISVSAFYSKKSYLSLKIIFYNAKGDNDIGLLLFGSATLNFRCCAVRPYVRYKPF
jgi:hypothetical protein